MYLQRVIVSGEGHQELPEGREGHQGGKLQAVVGRHVFEQHGEAVDRQVLPLELLAALQRHRPRHGQRYVHHHHRRHREDPKKSSRQPTKMNGIYKYTQ